MEDNEFLDLPDDPEEAFAVFQKREYERLSANSDNSWVHERRYVNKLVAFDEVHGLGFFGMYKNTPRRDVDFQDFFGEFSQQAEIVSQKIMMEAARRHKIGADPIIVLDDKARTSLHHFIGQIRNKLNELTMVEEKREALFNKLNAFAAEVDRNRTRTAAFLGFAVDVSRAGQNMVEPFMPIQRTIERVLDVIDEAKKWRDALPPWSERKKIEGPPKKLPPPSSTSSDYDDEIPF